jgi:tetratricopeptide (TPR) repeat protein
MTGPVIRGGDSDQTLTLSPGPSQPSELGTVGPYRLVEFLGRGGTGMVYRATDADQSAIALKVMTASPLIPPAEISRFLREAETAKRLRTHPNIITVYDIGQEGQDHYIAMELVPGGRTLQRVTGGNLSVKAVLDYAVPIAQALAYAHQEGILHRDIKPANILINEFNQPLLADFGLAKAMDAPHLTMTGAVLGTPRYMSPEQCGLGDAEVTSQSDIYSFGLVVYELLTGRLPYPVTQEMSLPEIFTLIRDCEPLPPRKLRPEISRNLEAVVLRMIDKEKRLRYKEMAQVCADLEACQAGRPVSVRRLSMAERWEKWLRHHGPLAITAAAALAIGGALYYGIVAPRARSQLYAKQQADVRALAARHRAAGLEKELEALRHPGTPRNEDDGSVGTGLLLLGREHLAQGRWEGAQASHRAAADWAEKNGHRGILLESRNSLARIALAKGNPGQAAESFQAVALDYGKQTLHGQLALFEAAAARWRQGKVDAAASLWQEIARINRGERRRGIDSRAANDYLAGLAEAMLNRGEPTDPAAMISSSPPVFIGLGYWVLAQKAASTAMRDECLAKATANQGIFVWINPEGDHASEP